MKKFLMTVLVMAAAYVTAAPVIRPLTMQEMARYGATDVFEVAPSDFADTTAENVAQTNTVTLTGPLAWSYVGFLCEQPYNDTKSYATNGQATTTNSIAVTVTLGSQTLVGGVQVAADQFRTYKAQFPYVSGIVMTNVFSGTVTNGATATLTWITGAPGAGAKLSNLTTGRSRLFLRIMR